MVFLSSTIALVVKILVSRFFDESLQYYPLYSLWKNCLVSFRIANTLNTYVSSILFVANLLCFGYSVFKVQIPYEPY